MPKKVTVKSTNRQLFIIGIVLIFVAVFLYWFSVIKERSEIFYKINFVFPLTPTITISPSPTPSPVSDLSIVLPKGWYEEDVDRRRFPYPSRIFSSDSSCVNIHLSYLTTTDLPLAEAISDYYSGSYNPATAPSKVQYELPTDETLSFEHSFGGGEYIYKAYGIYMMHQNEIYDIWLFRKNERENCEIKYPSDSEEIDAMLQSIRFP